MTGSGSGMIRAAFGRKLVFALSPVQTTGGRIKAASALMEGAHCPCVDNSPMVLLLPTTFSSFFQASDDYYNRWGLYASPGFLRYVASFIAMTFPGLYIAVACFHPEMLPTSLALSFAASRQGVPVPLAVEVLIMGWLSNFCGRLGSGCPGPWEVHLGIVGGLIIGQAAVDAEYRQRSCCRVVALTALAAFTIPNEGFASAFRLIKFYLITMGAFLGLFGVICWTDQRTYPFKQPEKFPIYHSMMPFVVVKVDPDIGC